MTHQPTTLPPSAAAYSRFVLPLYDAWVLRLSTPLAWGCSLAVLRKLYANNRSDDHVEVGVGTGFFLNRERDRGASGALTLVDVSPSALAYTASRLREQAPVQHLGDVLVRTTLPQRQFRSVGANFLLHCLPGPIEAKAEAVGNLAALTSPDGTLFGATVVNSGQRQLGTLLMRIYNRSAVFGNTNDTEDGVRRLLEAWFVEVELERRGAVVVFRASGPRRG